MATKQFRKIERYLRTIKADVYPWDKLQPRGCCDGYTKGYYFRMWDESCGSPVICVKDTSHKNFRMVGDTPTWPAFYTVGQLKKWIREVNVDSR